MDDVYFSVTKMDGGFLVEIESGRKIVRRISEVVAILKEVMKDQEPAPE